MYIFHLWFDFISAGNGSLSFDDRASVCYSRAMNRLTRNALGLTVGAAALAGFIDAMGFLQLRGLFVSFMSGNSTQLAVNLARGAWPVVGVLAAILGLFVGGTFIGTLAAHFCTVRTRVPAVIGLSSGLLVAAGVAEAFNQSILVVALMTLAMGVENAAFLRNGEVVVGLTYMTGTLVKLGQKLAVVVLGGEKFGWVPHLALWAGLVAGGVVGAVAFSMLGLASI
ncbi:MAG: YoaK family protein [Asticcacaulis sp.]